MDLSEIQGLLAQFQPNQADQDAARKQQIIMMGLGLLGARRGQELPAIGQAGLLGMQGRDQALHNATQQRMQGMQAAGAAMGLQEQMRKFTDQDKERSILGGMPRPNATTGMPSMSPTNANAAAIPSHIPGIYEQLLAKADALEAGGLPQKAQEYRMLAEKYAPQYGDTETLMQNGQPVTVQKYKNRAPETLSQYQPKPEMQLIDHGGTQSWIDKLRAAPGTTYNKTLSPEGVSSREIGLGNLAVAQGNLGVSRAHLGLAQQNANVGQLIETDKGYARVGKDNTITPVMHGDGQLQPKPTGAVQQQIASNNVMLNKIDRAIQAVTDNPSAMGAWNYLPDSFRQRSDSKGVLARSLVADIAGQKIHDRAGASQTVTEVERLKPYIPNNTDDDKVVLEKLGQFKTEYALMQNELKGGKSLAEASAKPSRAVSGGIKRTGTYNGRKVVQYSDDRVEYQ